MNRWLQEKYISLVSSYLPKFHKQSRTTWAFRCVFCGDSKRNENKTRGYIFLYRHEYFYKCHNCNASMSFKRLLKEIAPELFKEYQLDILREERPITNTSSISTTVKNADIQQSIQLPSVASLDESHIAYQYCNNRVIPKHGMEHIYYTEAWTEWIQRLGWNYKFKEDHAPRIVIPWYSRDNNLIGAQTRRIDVTGKDGRYVTLKRDDDVPKIYGLNKINFHVPVNIVEGPIDSLFIPNAVAAMDSDLIQLREKYLEQCSVVYIWDNEPRNKDVVRHMKSVIKSGEKLVIWPSELPYKDINDMAQANINYQQLIHDYTFHGLQAELEFTRWNRLK